MNVNNINWDELGKMFDSLSKVVKRDGRPQTEIPQSIRDGFDPPVPGTADNSPYIVEGPTIVVAHHDPTLDELRHPKVFATLTLIAPDYQLQIRVGSQDVSGLLTWAGQFKGTFIQRPRGHLDAGTLVVDLAPFISYGFVLDSLADEAGR